MQPQYITTASELAQKAPLTFVIIILSVILAGMLAGLLWVIWKGAPRLLEWLDKKAVADREHQKALIADVRADAAQDVKRADDAVSGAHKEIGAKVEAVHADVRRIAAKIGASVLLFLIFGWLALGVPRGARLFAAKCEPPCPEGQRCKTAIPRDCVEDKKGKTADKKKDATASGPRSGVLEIGRLAGYVGVSCDARKDEGCEARD